MSTATAIEWTDATWNPVTGCTKVSPGCDNCYAERITERFRGKGRFDEIVLHPERLEQPLHWRKPRRVFVNSMSDLFHAEVPRDFIREVWSVMEMTPQHTYQILTKRPARMRMVCSQHRTVPNVWLGVSVEDQEHADKRIPVLLDTPAAVRFLSCEPLLGPIDFDTCKAWNPQDHMYFLEGIHWVIVGGESGPKARPMEASWVRSILNQTSLAGVPFFFKQWGGRTPKANGRELDGRTWDEYPAVDRTGDADG